MLKIWCQSCGFPNEYASSKPSFCGKCRNSLTPNPTSSVGSKSNKTNKAITRIETNYNNSNPQEETYIPEIDPRNFLETIGSERYRVNIRQVIGTPKLGSQRLNNDSPSISKTKEQILRDFQKDATPQKTTTNTEE